MSLITILLLFFSLKTFAEDFKNHPEASTKTINTTNVDNKKVDYSSKSLDLLTQAQIIRLKAAMSLYRADRNKECLGLDKEQSKDDDKGLRCSEKLLTNLNDLVPRYLEEIPKINLGDKDWKGNNKNTFKIDKTTHTDILPTDIDGQTTWIFNPYYGNVMINYKKYELNDFIKSYTSTADEAKDIKSKLYFYTKAIEISNRYPDELRSIYNVSLYNAFIKRGNLYLDIKDYRKAIDDFLQAYQNAKLINDKEPVLISLISLSIAYKLVGDLKSAMHYIKELFGIEPDIERKIDNGYLYIREDQKEVIRSLFSSVKEGL